MEQNKEMLRLITRKQFFRDCGAGLGAIALSSLLNPALLAGASESEDPTAPRRPQFAAKARNVIYMHMAGAPSQLDLFDYKHKLQ